MVQNLVYEGNRDQFIKVLRVFEKRCKEGVYKKINYNIWCKMNNTWYDKVIIYYTVNGFDIHAYQVIDVDPIWRIKFSHTEGFGHVLNSMIELFTLLKNTVTIKENKEMKDFNFDFGPCTNDNIRMSIYGLAIQNNAGVWVSYNNGQIVDVNIFNFDGRKYMFKMPVAIKDIAIGDIIIHNCIPVFVTSLEGGIHVVDIREGESKTIIPTTNMFNFNFVTKVVSLFDAFSFAPTVEQPFGNMLPFLMMEDGEDIDPMVMFMMMNGGKIDMNNPMMLYFLLKDNNKDMLPFLFMNMQNPNSFKGNTTAQ